MYLYWKKINPNSSNCRDSSAVTPVEVHVDGDHSLETSSLGKSEASSNLQEYFQLAGTSAEKIDSVAPTPPQECPLIPTLRLKLPKGSKKRHHSSTVPEVAESDSASVHSDIAPSHVHFSELKECCVSFIDESPSADNDSSEEPAQKVRNANLFTEPTAANSDKRFSPLPRDLPHLKGGKSVKRSISFCSSSTEMSGPNALSNRAYKSPCSLQDISAEVAAKGPTPSLKTVPASSRPPLGAINSDSGRLCGSDGRTYPDSVHEVDSELPFEMV